METINLPIQQLEAEFAASEANRQERTLPMTFYSGAKVLQFNWEDGVYHLTLSTEPAHVRLAQLKSGRAPFTLGHAHANDPLSTIGVIRNPTILNNKAKADVRFSARPDVEPIYQDVLDGILANVSVGARLLKLKETTKDGDKVKSFLATDWEPFAVALVGLGADPNAHFAASTVDTQCQIEFCNAGGRPAKDLAAALRFRQIEIARLRG